MQLGCWACEEIIQVSAHPVAPSEGTTEATGLFSLFRKLTWYGQAVPITMSPLLNGSVSSVVADQYFLIRGACTLSSAMAASSCVVVSSYTSVMPRLLLWALR